MGLEELLDEKHADPCTGALAARHKGIILFVCKRISDDYWYGQLGSVIKTKPHVTRSQARQDLINMITRWENENP